MSKTELVIVKENRSIGFGENPEEVKDNNFNACVVINFHEGDTWERIFRPVFDEGKVLAEIEKDNVLVRKGDVKLLITHNTFNSIFKEA